MTMQSYFIFDYSISVVFLLTIRPTWKKIAYIVLFYLYFYIFLPWYRVLCAFGGIGTDY